MTRIGFSRKQLGQSRPANTTAVSIYSPGSNIETRVHVVIVCNTTSSAATYRICHDEDGTTYDETTALMFDVSLGGNKTDIVSFGEHDTGGIWMKNASGNLAVRTGTGNAINFTVYGEENIK